ncbi:hypothetical protein DVS28_b0070 (plasmid) [Euzebya pacifica]|uniref:Uncharacterized protein n=1 Tax=Euzebya pacifica TaxID=1608957 RepID=A0A346Y5U3_9ACTN|nr:hypothetical protein [Euzebya pacifica]AXV09840.1 hypothetical protein DVS28_b0070 [Euzebya pacifica]
MSTRRLTSIGDDDADTLAAFYRAEIGVTQDVLDAVRRVLLDAGINPDNPTP